MELTQLEQVDVEMVRDGNPPRWRLRVRRLEIAVAAPVTTRRVTTSGHAPALYVLSGGGGPNR